MKLSLQRLPAFLKRDLWNVDLRARRGLGWLGTALLRIAVHVVVRFSRSLASLQATRVVIAHRLSTIMHADYIYVMDKGAVVQEGTNQELIGREGAFADLARRQTA